jgi:hypothetical protein
MGTGKIIVRGEIRSRVKVPVNKQTGQILSQPSGSNSDEPGDYEYTVVPGDDLQYISRYYLGDEGAWSNGIYNYSDNKKLIGDAPGKLKPGIKLKIKRSSKLISLAKEFFEELNDFFQDHDLLINALNKLTYPEKRVLTIIEIPKYSFALGSKGLMNTLGQPKPDLLFQFSEGQRGGSWHGKDIYKVATTLYAGKAGILISDGIKHWPSIGDLPIATKTSLYCHNSNATKSTWFIKPPGTDFIEINEANNSHAKKSYGKYPDFVLPSYQSDFDALLRSDDNLLEWTPYQNGEWEIKCDKGEKTFTKKITVYGTMEKWVDMRFSIQTILDNTAWNEVLEMDFGGPEGILVDFLVSYGACALKVARHFNVEPLAVFGAVIWEYESELLGSTFIKKHKSAGSGRTLGGDTAGKVHIDPAVAIELVGNGTQHSHTLDNLTELHKNNPCAAVHYVANIISANCQCYEEDVSSTFEAADKQRHNIRGDYFNQLGLYHGFFGGLYEFSMYSKFRKYRIAYANHKLGVKDVDKNFYPDSSKNKMAEWVKGNKEKIQRIINAVDI